MHIVFLNPQGNFDPNDTGWTGHPDFGGQLVYVKELALAMGAQGHTVDIITRRIPTDERWSMFSEPLDSYPGHPNVRIIRVACGPGNFLCKEDLWPHLHEWVDNIVRFYSDAGSFPDAATAHYGDGGLAAVLLQEQINIPFTFTGHSLGAHKLDKLLSHEQDLALLNRRFKFDKRIAAERLAMARAGQIIVSTSEEKTGQYSHCAYRGVVSVHNDKKFSIIPPGVNLAIFGMESIGENDQEIASKIEEMISRDIGTERRNLPVVICSSRVEQKKNHIALVNAFAVSEQLRKHANLMIILRGDSDPLRKRASIFKADSLEILDEIVEVIEQNKLWPCVTSFDLNSQTELAAAFRHLARNYQGVFCLPALHEPFGLAPIEAMAAGLPTAATRNGGPAESLHDQNGDYGVLIDPEDPHDIAQGLLRLIMERSEWERFQYAGRARVENKYTWERCSASYLRVISALLEEDSQSSKEASVPDWFKGDDGENNEGEVWLGKLLSEDIPTG